MFSLQFKITAVISTLLFASFMLHSAEHKVEHLSNSHVEAECDYFDTTSAALSENLIYAITSIFEEKKYYFTFVSVSFANARAYDPRGPPSI